MTRIHRKRLGAHMWPGVAIRAVTNQGKAGPFPRGDDASYTPTMGRAKDESEEWVSSELSQAAFVFL